MKYDKPILIDTDGFEGVFASSGSSICDCFESQIERENHSGNFYSMSYYILQKDIHSHDNNDFGHYTMNVSFNSDINPSWTITPQPTMVSGNTITWDINSTISPYYVPINGMKASNHGINIKGDGVDSLQCTKITAVHM